MLFSISESKSAEYVTCDWTINQVEYWNSGSLTHYQSVTALNKTHILEIGKFVKQEEDPKDKTKKIMVSEMRGRIKTMI